jgi:hypothetical protein
MSDEQRVLLIRPYQNKHTMSLMPPLSMMCLAAYLRRRGNVQVRIIDKAPAKMAYEEVGAEILGFRPDWVGISTRERNIALARKNGIFCLGFFMLGFPSAISIWRSDWNRLRPTYTITAAMPSFVQEILQARCPITTRRCKSSRDTPRLTLFNRGTAFIKLKKLRAPA